MLNATHLRCIQPSALLWTDTVWLDSAEKGKDAGTQCLLSEWEWDTLQVHDPQPLTSPFQAAFLLLSEADKFIPLVSEQTPLFFYLLHQWKEEGRSRREGGRITSAWQCHTVDTGLMSLVLRPLGLGVWAPLSYNKVDKKPRAQPSGNLRGGVSRPEGKREGWTKLLRYIAPIRSFTCQSWSAGSDNLLRGICPCWVSQGIAI